MHVAGSQPAEAKGLFPNLPACQDLQVGEEFLRWQSEELGDLPSKKHTGGKGKPVSKSS